MREKELGEREGEMEEKRRKKKGNENMLTYM